MQAKTAVTTAEAELAEILKMRESAPQSIGREGKVSAGCPKPTESKEKEFTEFKKKVDLQKSKTEALPSAIPRGITQITFSPRNQFLSFFPYQET